MACPYCHGTGHERLENGDGTVCLAPCGWCGGKRAVSDATAKELARLHSWSASVINLR